MRFLAATFFAREQDLFSEIGIKYFSFGPVLAKHLGLLIAFFCYTILAHLEKLCSVVVVDIITVGELNQEIDRGRSGCMTMMHSWFWHLHKSLV